MNLNSLYQQCLYICIVVLIFTLALNVVSVMWLDLGAMPIAEPKGRPQEGNDTKTFENLQNADLTVDNIWIAGVYAGGGIAAILSIGASILSKSWAPFMVYLFGMIFWSSYSRSLIYFHEFGVPDPISGLFTIGIMFLFVGAAAAIYGGQN